MENVKGCKEPSRLKCRKRKCRTRTMRLSDPSTDDAREMTVVRNYREKDILKERYQTSPLTPPHFTFCQLAASSKI